MRVHTGRCFTSGSRDYAGSKDDACDARHSARKVQIARCSATTSKNCKISFLSCFVMSVNFPFFPTSSRTFIRFLTDKGNILGCLLVVFFHFRLSSFPLRAFVRGFSELHTRLSRVLLTQTKGRCCIGGKVVIFISRRARRAFSTVVCLLKIYHLGLRFGLKKVTYHQEKATNGKTFFDK